MAKTYKNVKTKKAAVTTTTAPLKVVVKDKRGVKPKRRSPQRSKGKGGVIRAVPAAVTTLSSGKPMVISSKGDWVTMRGSEYISEISISPLDTSPHAKDIWVNPASIGSRLGAQAKVWEKFKFTKLKLVYHPGVGTGTDGQFGMYYDSDISDGIGSGEDCMRMLYAHGGALKAVWDITELQCDLKHGALNDYFCGEFGTEDRVNFQGMVVWVYSGPIPQTGTVFGHLSVDYEINFYNPNLEVTSQNLVYGPTLAENWTASPTIDPLAITGVLQNGMKLIKCLDYMGTERTGVSISPKQAIKLGTKFMTQLRSTSIPSIIKLGLTAFDRFSAGPNLVVKPDERYGKYELDQLLNAMIPAVASTMTTNGKVKDWGYTYTHDVGAVYTIENDTSDPYLLFFTILGDSNALSLNIKQVSVDIEPCNDCYSKVSTLPSSTSLQHGATVLEFPDTN